MATKIRGAQIKDAFAGDALAFNGNVLDVQVDNATLEIDSDALRVKAGGIANSNLENSSLSITAGDALSGGGSVSLGGTVSLSVVAGTAISVTGDAVNVKYDNSTVGVSGDALYVIQSGIDHGSISGLGDDDHTQYSLADGSRDFTGVVSYDASKTFTNDADIVDKKYVDDAITATSGTMDHGALLGLSDNDHHQYLMSVDGDPLTVDGTYNQNIIFNYYATDLGVNGSHQLYVIDSGIDHDATTNYVANEHIDWTTDAGVDIDPANIPSSGVTQWNNALDHGTLSGLSDDDHTMYSRVDGTRPFTAVVGGVTPTDSAHLTTKGYVDGLIQGLDWQESVKDMDLTDPPGSPSAGDRYVVAVSGTGAWSGHDNEITEWNGSSWDFTSNNEGQAVWAEDEDKLYTWNGTAWVTFGSNVNHNNLIGLQGGATNEYYHLSATDYDSLVTHRRETIEDFVGGMVGGGSTQTNITVSYADNGSAAGYLDFSVPAATTTTLGVASFDDSDFDVSAGAVTLDATVPQSVSADSGSATPAASAFSIVGGEGIDTSAAGSTVTIAGEDASTVNKGIASFTDADFDVVSGTVSLEDTVVKSVSSDSGSATPSSHAFTIAGNGAVSTSAAGATVTVSVGYDDSTIGLSGNNLYVKDEGITEPKLDISNTPTDGYFLRYTTANGMTWSDIDLSGAITESDVSLENKSSECNGSTTGFTLTATPVDNSVQVFLNGLLQEKGSGKDYTQSGTSITFTVAPLSGDILVIHYIAQS